MLNELEEYWGDLLNSDLSELEPHEMDTLMAAAEANLLNRTDMLKLANKLSFEKRREQLYWTSVLDAENKRLDKPVTLVIKDIPSAHLKAILKWTDYDFVNNDSLVLHTIKEELNYRNKH